MLGKIQPKVYDIDISTFYYLVIYSLARKSI